MSIRSILTTSALLAVLCLSLGAFASYVIPAADTGTGVIQAVDYAAHTFTVNGHVYKLSPKAVYIGVRNRSISGLKPGTNINFTANGSVTSPKSSVVNIVVRTPQAP